MATGNNLIHRGRITRQLARGLESVASLSKDHKIDDIRVTFYSDNNGAKPLVTMPFRAALTSVAFDVAKQGPFKWGGADTVMLSLDARVDFEDLNIKQRLGDVGLINMPD